MKQKIAIVTINQPSLDSASRLVKYLDEFEVDIYGKKDLKHNLPDLKIYDKLDDILPFAWEYYDSIIPILAIGAVVRKIAPLLKDKSTDPSVIVINLALDKIVPLLSGHLGGANSLTNYLVSKLPNSIGFISTATDQTKTLAFDLVAKENSWQIYNLKALANISNRLLNKQKVKVVAPQTIFDTLDKTNLELINFDNIDTNSVVISPFKVNSEHLWLRPSVFLGIGCNRDTSFEVLENAILEFLSTYNLDISFVKNIASFEAKKDEKAILKFASKYNFDIKFFAKEQINHLEYDFSKSASTKFFGLKGVAEPSAILISKYKELIIEKKVYAKSVTIACSM